jgi:hypothetical protein
MENFREVNIVTAETNIELFETLNKFTAQMEKHIEQFPAYDYTIELLGGTKGSYKAIITIIKNDKKTELA